MDESRRYIEEHYQDEISLEQIAALYHLMLRISVLYLSRDSEFPFLNTCQIFVWRKQRIF